MLMVLVSLFVERPMKAIYVIIFNIILTWTSSSYTQIAARHFSSGTDNWSYVALFILTCLCLNSSQTSNSLPHSSVFILSSVTVWQWVTVCVTSFSSVLHGFSNSGLIYFGHIDLEFSQLIACASLFALEARILRLHWETPGWGMLGCGLSP